jgi:DNA-binding transcriptional regulator YdaS (Cro superfamily)
MQTAFAFLSILPQPKPAPDALVARMGNAAQAVAVSIRACGLKQAYLAAQLGISGAYLSQIRNGKRGVPDALVLPLAYLTGSLLVRQYLDLQDALAVAKGRTECAVAALANELRRAA